MKTVHNNENRVLNELVHALIKRKLIMIIILCVNPTYKLKFIQVEVPFFIYLNLQLTVLQSTVQVSSV